MSAPNMPDPSTWPIKEIALAIAARGDQLGLLWHLVPATVDQPGADGVVRVICDGDTVGIDAVTMIGLVPVGARVFVILSPPAGVHIVGFLGFDFPATLPGEAIGRERLIVNQADFPRTNDTMTAVPGMSFDVVAGAIYLVRLRAAMSGAVTEDVKVNWTIPSGTTYERYLLGINPAATGNYAATSISLARRSTANPSETATTGTGAVAGSTDFPGYWEDCYVKVGATPGTVQLTFARLLAAGANTVIFRGNSYMTVQRFR